MVPSIAGVSLCSPGDRDIPASNAAPGNLAIGLLRTIRRTVTSRRRLCAGGSSA
jgi:hypothetical protein